MPASAARSPVKENYSADDIDVLEGLEPVRRRPGMYIGGTDATALHHMFSEIIDNAIDEVVARHASRISVKLNADGSLTVRDDGRGIPVDPHSRYPDRSAAEVVLTVLHAGGKFSKKNYKTSGGLHGVGLSVVNALSDRLDLEIRRSGHIWMQTYRRGVPDAPLARGARSKETGTSITFHPDPDIFGDIAFDPARLYRMCEAKAYLVPVVQIAWQTEIEADGAPSEDEIHFPGGLSDALERDIGKEPDIAAPVWAGSADMAEEERIEWALAWLRSGQSGVTSFCNTISTPLGGVHEAGFRAALIKAFRLWGDKTQNRKTKLITMDDLDDMIRVKLSLFIGEPQFQGQTKEKLTNPDVARQVEQAMRDQVDHYFAADPRQATALLTALIERAEARAAAKVTVDRKTATRRLRLPGKLADCSSSDAASTELFLVEGDSAGGSAKQARDRLTQAILPLRGKILNVASASEEKLKANQEVRDLIEALGCGSGRHFDISRLRYGRIIIMTDADVDGSHIATLLMTLFFREMPGVIRTGRLYLAQPPLYRLTHQSRSVYLADDAKLKAALAAARQKMPNAKLEISRFKGLGEMPPATLKETTMNPARRTLLRVEIPPDGEPEARDMVERLMGRAPEARFRLIQENAASVRDVDL
ncbi:type IIA DNA topoisomerase subunit B (plasmid) [Acidiphilium multivorum]|uniref:DNA gyrase/topoisomerase IV subunit B n=1 Tax=Acidiphilium TaxID=522 RepID=UPI00157A7D8D|nr:MULTISPECIES: DNA topoisomerase IV subunit B [Acidiphilium]UNC16173.1 type IIA DNA topoisomerase subunit B [Acidiphilium multivorum]